MLNGFSRVLLSFLLVCWLYGALQAQEVNQTLIDTNYVDLSLSEIFDDLARKYQTNFYYQPEKLPAEKLSISFQQRTLAEGLEQILRSTELGFMFYRDYAVVVADKQTLSQFYTADYYSALEQSRVRLEALEGTDAVKLVVGDPERISLSGMVRFSGLMVEKESGEPIIGGTLFIKELQKGVATDVNGRFVVDVPVGGYEVIARYIGYEDLNATLSAYNNGQIEIQLEKDAITLDEVVVEALAADENVRSVNIGIERLTPKSIEKLPSFLGEVDIIKSLTLLPGVSTIGEGASGFNVRGGSVDQNLIMQDEAFVFNSSHALGFFSMFNPEMIKNVTLYKGAIPAQYGGRLSSVLDVQLREGSFEKFKLKGGLGVVSSKLSLEGPLKKGKSSFLIGGRATYSDWVLNAINVPAVQNSSVSFYDFNARFSQNFGDKTKLILTTYLSDDQLTFDDEFGFDYHTEIYQASLRNVIKPNLISSLSLIYSEYKSTLLNPQGNESFQLDTGIKYFKVKEQLRFQPTDQWNLEMGGSFVDYEIAPGTLNPLDDNSVVIAKELPKEQAREFAGFINSEWVFSPIISLSLGLRYNGFQNLGPSTIFTYSDPANPTLSNQLGTETFGNNQVIASYHSLEPRFSTKFNLTTDASLKLGYSRTTQFLHLISNTTAATPVDLWQLSDPYLPPEKAHNFSFGLFKNYLENLWETSVEFYYRDLQQIVEYRDFADLLANEHLETELLSGKGRSYGAEISIKKKKGRWNGWLSYTYARSERLVASDQPENAISNGKWFPSNFDKPHDLSLVANIDINRRHSFSFNFSYSTGRPTTGPIGSYNSGNIKEIPIYSSRNELRIPDYHRLDVAYTLSPSRRKDKKWKSSWTLSVYNIYSRKNAYAVFYTQPSQEITANRLSILGSIFPSLTYNFEIQ